MQMQEKPNMAYPNYTIYATYDQGSIKFVNHKPLAAGEEFLSFWNAYGLSTGLIVAGIVIGFVFILRTIPITVRQPGVEYIRGDDKAMGGNISILQAIRYLYFIS